MSTCPFAEQKRYDAAYPGRYSGGPNKGVLHTTEGGSLPAYDGGSKAPHFTVIPIMEEKRVRIVQHFDTARPARALANKAGGVQTNGDGAVQIELVGTCAVGGPGLHWPTAPRWALDGLAKLMRWIEADRGIPRRATTKPWLAYGKDPRAPGRVPASYGASPARMSQAEWDAFAGWCGHMHVPENSHGDPGSLDIGYLLGAPAPPPAPPAPPAPLRKAPDMVMFWHSGAVYLLVGGRRYAHGLPGDVVETLKADGVPQVRDTFLSRLFMDPATYPTFGA